MFRLTKGEAEAVQVSRSQTVTLKRGQNIKYLPYAFTEYGALMAANIFNNLTHMMFNFQVNQRDPESMLNWTERIIRMRKEVPEIGWGDFTVLSVRDPAVLALRYDWRNNSVLFLHNLHEQPREILLDPA